MQGQFRYGEKNRHQVLIVKHNLKHIRLPEIIGEDAVISGRLALADNQSFQKMPILYLCLLAFGNGVTVWGV